MQSSVLLLHGRDNNQVLYIWWFRSVILSTNMKVCFLRSAYEILYSHFFVILLITSTAFLLGCSDQKEPSLSGEEKNNSVTRGMIVAPGLKDPKVIAPLEDAWKRIDPKEDGWDSEVLNEVATKKLKALSETMKSHLMME